SRRPSIPSKIEMLSRQPLPRATAAGTARCESGPRHGKPGILGERTNDPGDLHHGRDRAVRVIKVAVNDSMNLSLLLARARSAAVRLTARPPIAWLDG